MGLRAALNDRLSSDELSLLKSSFDVVGDIAILDIPEGLEGKARLIADTLLGLVKNVRVVCAKVGARYGKYRRQRLRVLAGEERFTTIHRENGCVFHLDVRSCYFSPRLSNERLRIASFVSSGSVFVVGSGVGVYPVVISKNASPVRVCCIEHNRAAHEFALRNISVNKVDVQAVLGDVFSAPVRGVFDRIVIPAPHDSLSLLPAVFRYAKSARCFLHVYGFASDFDLFASNVVSACKVHSFHARVLGVVKCGQNKPRTYRVCADLVIRKKY